MKPLIGYYWPFPPTLPGILGPDGEPLRSETKTDPPKSDGDTLEFCDICGCYYTNGCPTYPACQKKPKRWDT